MKCSNCGDEAAQGQAFCGRCGAPLESVEAETVEQPASSSSGDDTKRSAKWAIIGSSAALVSIVLIGLLVSLPSGEKAQHDAGATSSPAANSPEDKCVSDASSAVGTMFHDWLTDNGANQDLAGYAATYGTSSHTFAAIQAGFTVLAEGSFRKGLTAATKEAVPKIQAACGLSPTTQPTSTTTTTPVRTTTTTAPSAAEERRSYNYSDLQSLSGPSVSDLEASITAAFASGQIPDSDAAVGGMSGGKSPVPNLTVSCKGLSSSDTVNAGDEFLCDVSGPGLYYYGGRPISGFRYPVQIADSMHFAPANGIDTTGACGATPLKLWPLVPC